MNVRQSNQDCIFFESTEELYKFRIKVPNEKLYVREKRDDPNQGINERAWKDGSLCDKGTVWEFDQKTSDVRHKCFKYSFKKNHLGTNLVLH